MHRPPDILGECSASPRLSQPEQRERDTNNHSQPQQTSERLIVPLKQSLIYLILYIQFKPIGTAWVLVNETVRGRGASNRIASHRIASRLDVFSLVWRGHITFPRKGTTPRPRPPAR